MMNTAVKEFLNYLNKSEAKSETKDLFGEPKKVSLQISLHKIPNLIGNKNILCKLPNSLYEGREDPQVCLIVKDIDPKDRDYEKTVRKYDNLIEEHNLKRLVSMVIPLKQLNLEFRHFEAKRKLSTSFDLFLADKCLHEILFSGSKLGKEFRKRRKMPIEIDINSANLKENIENVLSSTVIRLTGKGAIIDINTFLSTHTVEQAIDNINTVKSELIKHLPGGEANIKSIYLKSTDTISIPVYYDTNSIVHATEIKVKNNMTLNKKKRAKKLSVKRLQKRTIIDKKKQKKQLKSIKKSQTKPKTTTSTTTTTKNSTSTVSKIKLIKAGLKTKNKIKKSAFIK